MTSPPAPAPPSPLVAPREDTTRATSGVALFETAGALERAVTSDSWLDETLASTGFAIEFGAAVLDPLGALAAAGLGWLMEHVQPLSDVLDRLTGDPDAVTAQARTWRNVAAAVRAAGEDLTRATEPGSDWTGDAADAFRDASATSATEIGVSAIVADTLGAAVERAGNVVSLVRDVVRELIAQLIATLLVRIPQWTLEEIGTVGLATPHVVASALAVVAKVGKQVVGLVRALVGSLRHLGDLVDQVVELARRLFTTPTRPTPPAPAPTTPARTAPATPPLPVTPFGPGTLRAEGLSPRAVLGDLPTTPSAVRPPPTTPTGTARPPGPRPGSGPPSPEEMAQVSRIRAALEPDLPPLASTLPPVGPGTRTLVDALPASRVSRGPDGLIGRIDGRPYREVLEELGRRRADDFRAAREAGGVRSKSVGKVTSVAFDRVTGRVVESTNGRADDVLPAERLHDSLTLRLQDMVGQGRRYPDTNGDGSITPGLDGLPGFRDHPHPDQPLRHAEVKAVNDLLVHREASRVADPGTPSPQLGDLAVDNYYPFRGDGVTRAPCCANCSALLGRAEALPGRFESFPPTAPVRGEGR